jgi:hypothetical protein
MKEVQDKIRQNQIKQNCLNFESNEVKSNCKNCNKHYLTHCKKATVRKNRTVQHHFVDVNKMI